jgi:hypothetical protein
MSDEYVTEQRAVLASVLWRFRRWGQTGRRYRLLRDFLIGGDEEARELLSRRPHALGKSAA